MAIRENDDRTDDGVFPIIGTEPNTIALTAADGSAPTITQANGVSISRYDDSRGMWDEDASVSDVKIRVYVTDCRVALVCSRYDKGGGWIGSVGAMVVLNAASKIRAAVRSRGLSLVSQVRYPWLSGIGASPKAGWRGFEQIHFTCQDQATGKLLRLGLMFPKQITALDLANQIAHRCARHRLATEPDASPEALAAWQRAISGPVLHIPEKGKLSTFRFT